MKVKKIAESQTQVLNEIRTERQKTNDPQLTYRFVLQNLDVNPPTYSVWYDNRAVDANQSFKVQDFLQDQGAAEAFARSENSKIDEKLKANYELRSKLKNTTP